jgi:hypothetical protein
MTSQYLPYGSKEIKYIRPMEEDDRNWILFLSGEDRNTAPLAWVEYRFGMNNAVYMSDEEYQNWRKLVDF